MDQDRERRTDRGAGRERKSQKNGRAWGERNRETETWRQGDQVTEKGEGEIMGERVRGRKG